MINLKFARKWIHALESGKFEQGCGRLKTSKPGKAPAFCCLGVACEVNDPRKFRDEGMLYGNLDEGGYYGMPLSMVNALGLSHQDILNLVMLNDNGQSSFFDIAQTLRCIYEIWD